MACNIFYEHSRTYGILTNLITAALMRNTQDTFINNFIVNKNGLLYRFRLTTDVNDSITLSAANQLKADIETIIENYKVSHPDSTNECDKFQQDIISALNLENITQSISETQDIDTKTVAEIITNTETSLDESLNALYGKAAMGPIENLKSNFKSLVINAILYDKNSNTLIDATDRSLNENIYNIKNTLFKTIVDYLKKNFSDVANNIKDNLYLGDNSGSIDMVNYTRVMYYFLEKVIRTDNFQTQIESAYTDKIKGVDRDIRINKFSKLMTSLLADNSEYSKEINRLFKRSFGSEKRIDYAKTALYEANHFSKYFTFAKKMVKMFYSGDNELTQLLNEIETPDTTILDAANAYSILQNFDKLLKITAGNIIGIQKGTENRVAINADKYFYTQDTEHQRKSYSTKSETDADIYTSKLVKLLIESIDVYDYRTQKYSPKRLTINSYLTAVGKLRDSFLSGLQSRTSTIADVNKIKDLLTTFNDDPVVKLQQILTLLFKPQYGSTELIASGLIHGADLTNEDLNVLYSIYKVAFDSNNQNSFYSQCTRQSKTDYKLLEELAGCVNRNVAATYLDTAYDPAKELTITSKTKKEQTNKQKIQIISTINTIANNQSFDMRTALADKYPFDIRINVNEETDDNLKINNTAYTIDLGNNVKFSILVHSNLTAQLFSNTKDNMQFIITQTNSSGKDVVVSNFFSVAQDLPIEAINNIDLADFKRKIINSESLNDNEQILKDLLTFIDDFLGLNILSDPEVGLSLLETYRALYTETDGMEHWLMPLLKWAMRSAYINNVYLDATKNNYNTLKEYLEATKDENYLSYANSLYTTKPKTTQFSENYNTLTYRVVSFKDDALEYWASARSIFDGESSKSTTTDKFGNLIPNNSVYCLGKGLKYYLHKQKSTNTEDLLFVQNPDVIEDVSQDLTVTNKYGEVKTIKDLSTSELISHAIFNKFWGTYLANGKIIIQPTTYSDKTTYLNYILSRDYLSKINLMASDSDGLSEYMDTIGKFYGKIYERTENKLKRITTAWAIGHNIDPNTAYQDIMHTMTEQDLLNTARNLSLTDADKETLRAMNINGSAQLTTDNLNYIANKLSLMVEDLTRSLNKTTITLNELLDDNYKLSLDVEYQQDYRRIDTKDINGNPKQVVGVNELLAYNNGIFNAKTIIGDVEIQDSRKLAKHLDRERRNFIIQLIRNGCSFQAIESTDKYAYYTSQFNAKKQSSSNNVIAAIRHIYSSDGLKNYMKNWVDASSGKLILAKTYDSENNLIANVQNNVKGLNNAFRIELNPVLEKFFIVESLMSHNLKLSLVGAETNHAPGKNSNFNKARKITTVEQFNQLGLGTLTESEFMQLHNADGTGILDTALDLDQLDRNYHSIYSDIDNYLNSNEDVDLSTIPNLYKVLGNLIESSYLYNLNTAQNTQLKRNSIVTATLQQCTQNSPNGIPSKIKVAVIKDIQAPVWNYRGKESNIDACDGSAIITPMQAILENRSLGSQKVSYTTRKPIWYSYNTVAGTSFLAKFAAFTITNDTMKKSLNSKVSHHKLFKKMTNLQWDSNKIDLTKPLTESRSNTSKDYFKNWFKNSILDNKNLYYKDAYGNIIEITELNKIEQNGNTIYYTVEKSTFPGAEEVQRFHIFYDEVLQDGTIETSKHGVYDTYEEALNNLNTKTNAHTINSLYELHTALGSLYCVDINGNTSEFNNDVVVNYMCNIGEQIAQDATGLITQNNYSQPLKQYHIGYAFNTTAVKNGTQNVNAETTWSDNSELMYYDVDSGGLGMQLNAEDDIVNSELTEFSQVISASSAYGFTYDNCNELYSSLAKSAINSSKITVKAVDDFIAQFNKGDQQVAISALYDAIGRIMISNSSIQTAESLTPVIIDAVKKIFDTYYNHDNDDVKIPFSDYSIYTDFISTLASTINKASIKRKHPGAACVLSPGYGMVQYFELRKSDGTIEKLFSDDILNRARADYKAELVEYLKEKASIYDPNNNIIRINDTNYSLNTITLSEMENIAITISNGEIFSQYYTTERELGIHNKHLIDTFLAKQRNSADMPSYDISYFMPSDVVDEFDSDGNFIRTIDLNSLDTYYKFKEESAKSNHIYKASVAGPHNLRPSTIRWQYNTGEIDANGNPIVKYMNYFDLDHVKNAYNTNNTSSIEYQMEVQKTLHDLYNGKFTMGGVEYFIIENSLENEAAELVMGNIYKDVFGIENESISEILELGEDYFRNKIINCKLPTEDVYDIAFLKTSGKHTLITFNEVNANGGNIAVNPFVDDVSVNESGEIYYMNKGQRVFKVGRWVNVDPGTVIWDSANKKFINSDKSPIYDQKNYRLKGSTVQKRIDYVKRYNYLSQKKNGTNNVITTNTLYQIADVSVFKEAMKDIPNYRDNDAYSQRAHIVKDIYLSDDFVLAEIRPDKMCNTTKGETKDKIKTALTELQKTNDIDNSVKQLLNTQINNEAKASAVVEGITNNLKNKISFEIFHARWISFLDSVNFISSRIPAQSLQSFMAMKLIGWTGTDTNIAYASHFQTYLQGSDYDIDKAYIMGQSYDSNGKYIAWSPYFDYTSIETLRLSKTLSIPKNINIIFNSNTGVDISNELQIMKDNSTLTNTYLYTTNKTEKQKIAFLKALRSMLYKVEKNNGVFKCDDVDKEIAMTMIQRHNKYQIPNNIIDGAYKNCASANIYNLSHDIRNRDQAYTAISMDMISRAADLSPKGQQVSSLNMTNPVAKYIMQNENKVGKNVIGITANGEKFWFRWYYYWNKALKSNDQNAIKKILFSTTLSRVKGRADGIKWDRANSTVTTKHIPDLNMMDIELKNTLMKAIDVTEINEQNTNVDQKISELLSAATDNAKVLILSKINADTNFAKMYLHLIMLGYNLNDIVAFMTTPVSEFIINNSSSNMFTDSNTKNSVFTAINKASGLIRSSMFLQGTYKTMLSDGSYQDVSKSSTAKRMLLNYLNNNLELNNTVHDILNIENSESLNKYTLDVLMQSVIQAGIINYEINNPNNLDLIKIFSKTDNTDIISYSSYCNDVYQNLLDIVTQYEDILGNINNNVTTKDALDDMLEDIKEFKKIYNLATETSNIASSFLGLNRGLPTNEVNLIKLISNLRRVVTSRESAMNVTKELFEDDGTLNNERFNDLYNRIKENNQYIEENDVRNALIEAHNRDIIGNFDPIQMLIDDAYREAANNYLNAIKGTVNAIDMIYSIPDYKAIVDCLKTFITSKDALSVKSRMISKLIKDNTQIDNMDYKQLSKIVRFVNETLVNNFLNTDDVPIITLDNEVDGFNEKMQDTRVTSFDLTTVEGISGFNKFMTTDFYKFLQEQYADNSLVKHLVIQTAMNKVILTTDIDLLNPGISTTAQQSYYDIINGMQLLENEPFLETGLSIADMIQLYNIIVNLNMPGSNRLTTTFSTCSSTNSILNKFYKFIGNLDYDTKNIPDYDKTNFQISTAPIVSEYAARGLKLPFIKVKDPAWDFIVKIYNHGTKSYMNYLEVPYIDEPYIEQKQKDIRRSNYAKYYPFSNPNKVKEQGIKKIFSFAEATNEDIKNIKDVLINLTSSDKILIYKVC